MALEADKTSLTMEKGELEFEKSAIRDELMKTEQEKNEIDNEKLSVEQQLSMSENNNDKLENELLQVRREKSDLFEQLQNVSSIQFFSIISFFKSSFSTLRKMTGAKRNYGGLQQ